MPDIPQLTYNSVICKTARAVKKIFKLEVKLKLDFKRLIRKIVLLWQGGVAISFDILSTLANSTVSAVLNTLVTMLTAGALTSGFALFHSIITFLTSGAQAKIALFMVVCNQLKKSLEARIAVAEEVQMLGDQLKVIILKFLQLTETAFGTEDDLQSLIKAKTHLKTATDNLGVLINKLDTLNLWSEANYGTADAELTKAELELEIELVTQLQNSVHAITGAFGLDLANNVAGVLPGDDGYVNPTGDPDVSINDFIEQQISSLEALGIGQGLVISGIWEVFNEVAPKLVNKIPMVELFEYYNVGSALFSSQIAISGTLANGYTLDNFDLNYPEDFSLSFWNDSVRAVVEVLPKIEANLESASQFSTEVAESFRELRKAFLSVHDEIQAEINERTLNFIEINIKRMAWASKVRLNHTAMSLTKGLFNVEDVVLMQQLDALLTDIKTQCSDYPEQGKHPYEEAVSLYQKTAFHFFKVFQTREKAITVVNSLANASAKVSEGVSKDKILLAKIDSFLSLAMTEPLIAASYNSLEQSLQSMEESDNPVQKQIASYIRNGNIAPLMAFVTQGMDAFSSIISGEAWDSVSGTVSAIADELSIENIQEACFGEAVIEQETLNEQDMEITKLEIDAQVEQAEIDQLDEVDGPGAFGIDGDLHQPDGDVDFLSEDYTGLA